MLFSPTISHSLEFTTISNLKTVKFKTVYLLETLNQEILEIHSSAITKSRLMCFDWLFRWNICRLSCEEGSCNSKLAITL